MESIVLLSGGLDSTVSLSHAIKKTKVLLALTFDYGQKAAKKELEAAKKIADYYQIKQIVIDLDWLKAITNSALVSEKKELPLIKTSELDSKKALDTAKKVWVPNRNGLFINIAACFAESLDANLIVTGFNAEEAVSFSDNSLKFIESINKSMSYSTLNKVKVLSYTQALNKQAIIKLGIANKAPLDLIWSCYLGLDEPCQKCESCLRLKRAKGVNKA